MATRVERFPGRRVSARAGIAIGSVVVVLAAIGGGMLIGRATVSEPAPAPAPAPEGLAAPAIVRKVDAHIAALNAGDTSALAAFYSRPYAILTDDQGKEVVGASRIAGHLTSDEPAKKWWGSTPAWELERVSEVFQFGDMTMYPFTSDRAGIGLMVLMLDINHRIVHQWVLVNELSRRLAWEASES